MAIDRNIITWNVEGFRGKSYIEIYNMLYTNKKAIYGSDIDLSADTGDGEYLRMEASIYYTLANLAQEVYYSLDVNNAKGQLLDILLYQSGNMVRKGNTNTLFRGFITWTGENIYYNLPSDTQGSSVWLIQDKFNTTWRVRPITDSNVTGVLEIEGIEGIEAEFECVDFGNFLLDEDISEMILDGSFITNENILVTNKIIDRRGSTTETDSEFRMRKRDSMVYNSTTLTDSIKIDIMENVLSVKDVVIFNANNSDIEIDLNINGVTQTQVIPIHYVFVMVQPVEGTDLTTESVKKAISDSIRKKITLGISTLQKGSATSLGDNYIENEYSFSIGSTLLTEKVCYFIATRYNPEITIKLRTSDAIAYDKSKTSIESAIKEAVINFSRTHIIGQDIERYTLGNVVRNTNSNLQDPLYEVVDIVVSGSGIMNGYWLTEESKITIELVGG